MAWIKSEISETNTEGRRQWQRPQTCLGPVMLSALGLFACQANEQANGETTSVITQAASTGNSSYLSTQNVSGSFELAAAGKAAPLVVSSEDYAGVLRVAKHLQADINRVTGTEPQLSTTGQAPSGASEAILIGTIGKSPLIDGLASAGKIDTNGIAERWETFLIQAVDAPVSGVSKGLVIAGSDKRGTIYGMYDLSEQIGVSPWYYWADVPARRQTDLYVTEGRHTLGEPAIKYRGIFINHEGPALNGWADQNFGGFKSAFYDKVFELIMRMKGNLLWPAMWGRAFYTDDTQNAPLADEYGVFMGTSHHEPMTRAQQEWKNIGTGDWNYQTNETVLKDFWTGGIQRIGTKPTIVTVGMRGDGDVAMTAETNIALLQQIISDQRQIIQTVTGNPPSALPQVWTLYKEAQDYFDQGMTVPDDITLIFSDDNYGNMRKLPKAEDPRRTGGYGAYYHFEYLGDPRGYRWLNSSPLPRVWEQMHLVDSYKTNQLWVVNVGDIKPLELPIHFFLEYAWNPDLWTAENIADYPRVWAERQFGAVNAAAIGSLLAKYSKYNGRRKIELLSNETYSQVAYRESETVAAEYNALIDPAQKLYDGMGTEYKDAFYELVLHPIRASATVNELYHAYWRNQLYAKQGRASANTLAARVKTLFQTDADMTNYFNQTLAGGKWNHMMDQVHIGYTTWEAPATNTMPAVTELQLPTTPNMGVAIEGSTSAWPAETAQAVLDELTLYYPKQDRYIEVFNQGQGSFQYTVSPGAAYVVTTPASGTCETEQRVLITVDWTKAPIGKTSVPITIAGPNSSSVVVQAVVNNPESPRPENVVGFVETAGYVSMEAEHFTQKAASNGITWQKIPDLGRTLSGMTPFPVTAASQTPGGDAPHLEYQMHLSATGDVKVRAYLSPTLNIHKTGLRYAVSFDGAEPQTVNMHTDMPDKFDEKNAFWQAAVSNSSIATVSTHNIAQAGTHVLKFWMVDAGIVLEKLVVETGTVKPSYLGPPGMLPLNATQTGSGGSGSGGSGGNATASAGTTAAAGGSSNQPGSGGGAAVTGGTTTTAAGGAVGSGGTKEGCGCSVPGNTASASRALWALALILMGLARRRRARRSSEA